ncbi:MAG: hypothetical protein QXT77_02735 [Candidatus Methanomethylicaceae archaeon]
MVYRLAVVTSKELRERFGWSEQQLRRRLAALRAAGIDGLRRGPNGVYLIPDDLAKVLAEIARLEKDGLGPSEALRRALEGVNGLLPPSDGPLEEQRIPSTPVDGPFAGADELRPKHGQAGEKMQTYPALVAAVWILTIVIGVAAVALWALVIVLARR